MVVQRVLEDPLDRLTGVLRDQPQHGVPGVPQVVRLQLDVDSGPADPAEPWCSSTRAFGSAFRLPLVPADSRNCPAL